MSHIVYGLLTLVAFIGAACVEYYMAYGKLKGIRKELPGLLLRGLVIAVVSVLLLGSIDGRIQCSFAITPAPTESNK